MSEGWQPQAKRSPERSRTGWGWLYSTIPKAYGFEAATAWITDLLTA